MDDATHPPRVRDQVTGQVARLMFEGTWRDPVTRQEYELAFLRSEGGGREWAVEPKRVAPESMQGAS